MSARSARSGQHDGMPRDGAAPGSLAKRAAALVVVVVQARARAGRWVGTLTLKAAPAACCCSS